MKEIRHILLVALFILKSSLVTAFSIEEQSNKEKLLYETLFVEQTQKVDIDLNLYSLDINDYLKHKTKYGYSVKKGGGEGYVRSDRYALKLLYDRPFQNTLPIYGKVDLDQGIVVERFFKDKDSAYRARPFNPFKIPVNYKNFEELNVGDKFYIPTMVSLGVELSSQYLINFFELSANAFLLYSGLIQLDIKKIDHNKLNLVIRTGSGIRAGHELRFSLFSPEIVFSILDYQINKVLDLKLISKKSYFNDLEGTLLDLIFDFSDEESIHCYNSFFKKFYRVVNPKLTKIVNKRFTLKSLDLLRNCSDENDSIIKRLDTVYKYTKSVRSNSLNPLLLNIKNEEMIDRLIFDKGQNIISYRKKYRFKSPLEPFVTSREQQLHLKIQGTKEKIEGELVVHFYDSFLSRKNIKFLEEQSTFYFNDEKFISLLMGKVYSHHREKVLIESSMHFKLNHSIDERSRPLNNLYLHLDLKRRKIIESLFKTNNERIKKNQIVSHLNRLEELIPKLLSGEVNGKEIVFLRRSKVLPLILPGYLQMVANVSYRVKFNQMQVGGTYEQDNMMKEYEFFSSLYQF